MNKNTKCLDEQKHKMFGRTKTQNVWKNKNTNVWTNKKTKCLDEQKHKMLGEQKHKNVWKQKHKMFG